MSVRITTLGQVRVHAGARETPVPQQRLRCAVLIHLAAEGETSREALLAMFWPDKAPARARHILSQTLYELRRTLGEDALLTEVDRVRIGPGVSIDVREFESLVERGELDVAIAAYGGEFCAGFPLHSTNGFETWADRKRAHLARLHRRARREQIHALEQAGQSEAALAAARAWADAEPLDDEAQHRLFELLLRSGGRVEARTRFEQYQQLIRKELDVAPLDETTELFEEDRRNEVRMAPPPAAPMPKLAAASPVHDPSPRPAPAPPSESSSAGQPARLRKGRVVMIAAAAVVLAFAIYFAGMWSASDFAPVTSLQQPIEPSGLDPTRIAVLYFDDHSERGDLGHIANGLTDALIQELSSVEALSVVTRNGVKPFAQRVVPLDTIVQALRVGTIVNGSVQRSGDRLRVVVQLVQASDSKLLENETLERPIGELFELQDDIARRVAHFLRNRLGREISLQRRMREASSIEAYLLVQKAVEQTEHLWASEISIPEERAAATAFALSSADTQLATAEQMDPSWAEPVLLRGWVALARAKLSGTADTAAYNRWISVGLGHADRLLRRDSSHARALELRGTLKYHLSRANHRRPDAALLNADAAADLHRAVGKDEKLAGAWNTLSRLHEFNGEAAEAKEYVERALAYDTYLQQGPDILQRLYRISLDLEDFEQAREYCLSGHADYPGDRRFIDCQLSIATLAEGFSITPDSARVLIARVQLLDPPTGRAAIPAYRYYFRRVLLARTLARAGRWAEARDSLDQIQRDLEPHPQLRSFFAFDEAHLALLLGDTTRALDGIARYLEEFPELRAYVGKFFIFKPLHDDPRFTNLVAASPR